MKKPFLLLAILLFLSITLGFAYGRTIPQKLSVQPTQQITQSPSPTTEAVLGAKEAAIPSVLSIPTLGIEVDVESRGLDSKGNMDVPVNWQNVAWYNLGAKPGTRGNAVMAGHLDTVTGAPAVFYNLDDLQIGDEIKVTDANGTVYTYHVTGRRTYPYNAFPLQEVFGDTDKYRLNLITCGGQFNNSAQNYSHRVVVYSELVR